MHNQDYEPVDFSRVTIYELPRQKTFSMKYFMAGATAVTLTASLAYSTHSFPESTQHSVASEPNQDPSHLDGATVYHAKEQTDQCPTPNASDIATVETLLSKPAITYTIDKNLTSEEAQKYESFYNKTVPHEFGVTIHKPDALYRLNLYSGKKIPFESVLQGTQDFLDNYGVSIKVMTPAEAVYHSDMKSSIPTAKELDSTHAKQTLFNIAASISMIPEEYVRQVGLKHILLVTKGDNFAAYAETGGPNNTIVVSVDQEGGYDLLLHEFVHLADTTQCGGPEAAGNDPAYDVVNGATPYDNELGDLPPKISLRPRPLTYEDVVTSPRHEANSDGGFMPCDEAHAVESSMKVYSEYSYTNVVEDKAELGKNLFERYSYQTLISERTPALRQKALILLARMYKQNPNVVRYLVAISERPTGTDPFCDPDFSNK